MRKAIDLLLTLLVATAVSAGCSSATTTLTCNTTTLYPGVQLRYPAPGSTGVSSAQSTIVYGAFPNASFTAGPVSIFLEAGNSAMIPTTSTSLPAPEPSPLPTPVAAGESDFAVTSPALGRATTYTVFAVQNVGSCGSGTTSSAVGTFTTQ